MVEAWPSIMALGGVSVRGDGAPQVALGLRLLDCYTNLYKNRSLPRHTPGLTRVEAWPSIKALGYVPVRGDGAPRMVEG